MTPQLHIGFLIYPDVTQLDFTGPAQVLSLIPGAKIHLIWKDLNPVESDAGFSLLPNTTFDNCPPLDVICVPGGRGQIPLMQDAAVLEFLKHEGDQARYVTSVCSGCLLLGGSRPVTGL